MCIRDRLSHDEDGNLLSRQVLDYALWVLLPDAVSDLPFEEYLLYPNPSTGTLRISNSEYHSGHYTVYDLTGKTVRKGKAEVDAITLELEPGIYHLHLTDREGDRSVVTRVVLHN